MDIVANSTDTAVLVTETVTKFGLLKGAELDVGIYDHSAGVTDRWLQDWAAGTWGAAKAVERMTPLADEPARHEAFANLSATAAQTRELSAFIEIVGGGKGASEKRIVLLDRVPNLAAIKAQTDAGGPGPWTTASGDPVIANPIIEAINAQTSVLSQMCGKIDPNCIPPYLKPVIYTGHKGDNYVVPVFRNSALMPDSELANGSQFSMNFRNVTTGDTFNVTDVTFAGTGHLQYRSRAGDSIAELAGKWEYQADGLTQQGVPFESVKLSVRVYDDIP